jgi:sugar (pentulose or hexulose) kinase
VNNEPVFLGVDLGTSSVKAQLVAGDGQVVSTSRVEYGHFDNGVQFDQDPEEIWRALVEAVRLLGRKTPLSTVAAMGVVGHAPSMVWVDHSGVPLTRVMGWRAERFRRIPPHR